MIYGLSFFGYAPITANNNLTLLTIIIYLITTIIAYQFLLSTLANKKSDHHKSSTLKTILHNLLLIAAVLITLCSLSLLRLKIEPADFVMLLIYLSLGSVCHLAISKKNLSLLFLAATTATSILTYFFLSLFLDAYSLTGLILAISHGIAFSGLTLIRAIRLKQIKPFGISKVIKLAKTQEQPEKTYRLKSLTRGYSLLERNCRREFHVTILYGASLVCPSFFIILLGATKFLPQQYLIIFPVFILSLIALRKINEIDNDYLATNISLLHYGIYLFFIATIAILGFYN